MRECIKRKPLLILAGAVIITGIVGGSLGGKYFNKSQASYDMLNIKYKKQLKTNDKNL